MKVYNVFTRTWWKENPNYPNGLKPSPGRKHYLAKSVNYDEAIKLCKEYNSTHKAGRLSKKAEFQSI